MEVPELNDKEWHHVCAMWENTAGMASLFVDGAMRTQCQGEGIGWAFSWDGLFVLGDRRDAKAEFTSILICVKLWEKIISNGEVRMVYEDKKCKNNSEVSIAWPWFKMAELDGQATWANFSSLLKEDLGMYPRLEE